MKKSINYKRRCKIKSDADKWREKQAEILLDLFREKNGYSARNMEELERFVKNNEEWVRKEQAKRESGITGKN